MTAHEAQLSANERTLVATATRIGAHAQTAARATSHVATPALLVGGVLVAPALAILALVSLFAPGLGGLRHVAPALIFMSLLWLALAILGAHAQASPHAEPSSADPSHL